MAVSTAGEDDFGGATSAGIGKVTESTPKDVVPDDGKPKRGLLVFERSASWMFQLPASGEVVVGRGETAGLRLNDRSVSRRHAVLSTDDAGVTISDAGSQNGTSVNGERLAGDRVLQPGDSIAICSATLVYYMSVSQASSRVTGKLVEMGALRERVAEEVERSVRYQRPFIVLFVLLRSAPATAPPGALIEGELRRLEIAAWASPTELLVLAPELGPEEAAELTRRMGGLAARLDPEACVGYAVCPTDSCEAEGLLAGARAAALGAGARGVAAAATSFGTIQIAGRSVMVADPGMSRLYALIERTAVVELPVLIIGETGTGKELAATALHERSRRRKGPLVALNCATLQESLAESTLFGHERGAFSGAVAAKPGLLEAASGGTLFLDEIGELSLAIQAKLLRVLEVGRMTRVGEVRERAVDVRLVAATHRDLEEECHAGRFRQDLYFRLNGALLHIPPLRERRREVALLAQQFLAEACAAAGRSPMEISPEAHAQLLAHAWPGNVRELKNLMGYLAAAHAEKVLSAEHVSERLTTRNARGGTSPPGSFRPLADEIRELEIRRIHEALAAAGGNHTRAAELIGMPARTWFSKLKLYGIRRS